MPGFTTSTEPLDRLGLRSSAEINRVLRERRFPFEDEGWYAFIYHDPEQRLESVRLLHGLVGYRRPPVFRRLPGGVHVLGLHAPGIRRFEYEFELREEGSGARHVTIDPLNALTAAGPFGARSVALGDGYAEPIQARPPGPEAAGTLRAIDLPISLNARHRPQFGRARLWQPAGATNGEALPLLVVLDGPEYARYAGLTALLGNLIARGEIAPCRAVLLPPTERNRQYSADPATAVALAELLPAAFADHAPWPTEARDRIGLGASLGGLALLHAHAAHPGLFGGLILQSGSYFRAATDGMEQGFRWFGRISHFVSGLLDGSVDVAPIPMILTCGLGGENLPNNRAMVEALRARGIAARLTLVGDAHNWIAWRDCVVPGIKYLLGGTTTPPGN